MWQDIHARCIADIFRRNSNTAASGFGATGQGGGWAEWDGDSHGRGVLRLVCVRFASLDLTCEGDLWARGDYDLRCPEFNTGPMGQGLPI